MLIAKVELISNPNLPVWKRKKEGRREYLSYNQSLLDVFPLPLYETIHP